LSQGESGRSCDKKEWKRGKRDSERKERKDGKRGGRESQKNGGNIDWKSQERKEKRKVLKEKIGWSGGKQRWEKREGRRDVRNKEEKIGGIGKEIETGKSKRNDGRESGERWGTRGERNTGETRKE
jgi:hypothetical protein